jgi:hypothetical protein
MVPSLVNILLGEQLAYIGLAILLVIVLLACLLSWWLVRRFRSRLGLRVYLLPLAVFLLLAVLIYLPFWLDRPSSGPPQIIPAAGIRHLVGSLPDYANFSYSGLAYYGDALYVGTNIGLIEIVEGEPSHLLQFQKSDYVVSGPWVDRANQIMWIEDEHVHGLVRFDGKSWTRVPMPTPQKGYYTRGDVLEGFQAIPDSMSLTFVSAGSGWRWDQGTRTWALLSSPPQEMTVTRESTVIGLLPLEKDLFLVRHQPLPFLVHDGDQFQSDTISYMWKSWTDVPGPANFPFLADKWISAHGVGYICTKKGELLRITTKAVSMMDTPGQCEAMATTDAGNLLGSFRGKGIYEFTNHWELRAVPPYPEGTGEYWAYLATHGDEIAYAIDGMPIINKERSKDLDIKWTVNAPTRLWVIKKGQARELLSFKQ